MLPLWWITRLEKHFYRDMGTRNKYMSPYLH